MTIVNCLPRTPEGRHMAKPQNPHNPPSDAHAGCRATDEAKPPPAEGRFDAGLTVRGVEADPVTGALRVLVGKPGEPSDSSNSWDEVLNVEDAKRPA